VTHGETGSASFLRWREEGLEFLGVMKPPFRLLALLLVSLATLQFSGCTTTSPATRAWEEVASDSASECEDPSSDQCIVLACDGEAGVCGVFACEDVDPEAVARSSLVHGVGLARYRPPMRSPGSSRNWRNTGLREGTRPRMSFHFRYRESFLPAFPKLEGRLVKHHLFPQAADLARWFKAQGIQVHAWTMVIPERVHWRIHSGSARGGLWNQAWREFRDTNPTRRYTQEE
jgi:uncharacterized lipoprotein (TIGR02269 family)